MDKAEKRKCRRCQLYEQLDKRQNESFDKLIDRIPSDERTEDSLYDKRLSCCEKCGYIINGTCRACGCYVELRAAMKQSECPHSYWPLSAGL